MALHHLLVMDKGSKKILYSETYHSQAEYVGGLLSLVEVIAPFKEVQLSYIAPEPFIGRSRSKTFTEGDMKFFLKMIKGG